MNLLRSIILRLKNFKNLLVRMVDLADAAHHPGIFIKYLPERRPANSSELFLKTSSENLPVPPSALWLGYGKDIEGYLKSGLDDVNKMLKILCGAGFSLESRQYPVLDLGCGGGRMIRHLQSLAASTEVWGVDISVSHINWLKTHLSPPFNFAVNTTLPHLPFEDGYFGLVYCGSLFTHIDDLAESWFLEVRRVLRPGGFLYCTLHDEQTRKKLTHEPFHPLAKSLRSQSLLSNGDEIPDILIAGHSFDSNVFYSSRYLSTTVSRWFELVDTIPSAYGYQTAWILRKRVGRDS